MLLVMLSLGILLALAFAMTSNSLLFVDGSLPPAFTATAISLPILVNIFPFAASPLAFCV